MQETTSYPEYFKHTRRMMGALGREMQGTMGAFGELHKQSLSESALSPKVKELIALALSVKSQCHTCMTYHVHDALEAGATREEIMAALEVTILMGGAPAVAHAINAVEALNQFTESKS